MLFNSFQYLIFLPLVVAVYYLLPQKWRWVLLLAASYYFYMVWNAKYIVLIVTSTLIDYVASLLMEKQAAKSRRRLFLLLSLLANLGLLFVFKYFNFFSDAFSQLADILLHRGQDAYRLNILLPMGISFYTFQTLSYTIDVYRGVRPAEKHLGYFALYVSFFPQLVAGPIERSERLLPQFKVKHTLTYEQFLQAMTRIVWGFFKKVVIADRVAILVNTVYNDVYSYDGIYLYAATLGFAVQIYCDFSAYSDIAIGSARLLGIGLMENFKMPYFSRSVGEFWSRWHISLSTWFRDYLYIPLGGSRNKREWMTYRNILIVFAVSGLWHGANWTFILWGLMHGLILVAEKLLERGRETHPEGVLSRIKIPAVIHQLLTFVFVSLTWVLFRANSLADAVYIYGHLKLNNIRQMFAAGHLSIGLDKKDIILLAGCVLGLFAYEAYRFFGRKEREMKHDILQGIAVVLLAAFVLLFGYYGLYRPSEFIYFQF